MAEVELAPPPKKDKTVVPAGVNCKTPDTSQSPAVREMEVTLAGVAVVRDTEEVVALVNSPTLPALALLFVVVPTMPLVWEGVKFPLDASVVKLPARLPPVTAELTIAVVAICVVLVVADAVGAAGVPVNVGEANRA